MQNEPNSAITPAIPIQPLQMPLPPVKEKHAIPPDTEENEFNEISKKIDFIEEPNSNQEQIKF